MKRFFYTLLLICVATISFNCQKELSNPGGQNNGGNPSQPAPITAALQGRVIDENGQPASNVSVKAGSKTATTDARGFFRINAASLDKNASVVTAEKTGYFKAYRSFQATSGANNIAIKLIKKVAAGTISSATGGDATLTNGAKVSLPANGVVKAAGGTYTGSITVYAAYIDPTSSDINQTIPGSYMADDKNGKRVTLISYGMLAVELESATGEKLQIAADKKATLTAPIPASRLSAAPATIALWYVDEQTGIWKEQGTATKTGSNYVGEVSHFSFWNCDQSFPAVNLSLTVKTPDGSPLVRAWVTVTRTASPNGWNTGWAMTDSAGKVSGLVPSNEPLLVEVRDDCGNVQYSQNAGPLTQNTDLGTLTVPVIASNLLTFKGKLLNCSGAPVTNGFAIISYNYYTFYTSVNSSGEFDLSILRCNMNFPTCNITGVDNTASQQNTVVGIPVVLPVTNAGNISACGVSTTQYVNFTDNGINYTINPSTPNDSIYMYTYSTNTNTYYTTLNGFDAGNTKRIYLSFNHPTQSPGTYAIGPLSTETTSTSNAQPPSDITLTQFPQTSGEFYEGSFSGSYFDIAGTLHNVSGTFRVRRY